MKMSHFVNWIFAFRKLDFLHFVFWISSKYGLFRFISYFRHFVNWTDPIFGTAFVKVPKHYQWILALLSPFVKDLAAKLMLAVAFKSAGKENKGKYSVKFPALHYVTTKHAVFLAIIVGGVATPATSICIMATDFAKTLQSTWKIIRKYKNDPDSDIEGIIISLLYFVFDHKL